MVASPPHSVDRFGGYSHLSVILHWSVAVLVVALYVTGGPTPAPVHLALGLVATPIVLMRVFRRFGRGYPRIADQPQIFNLIERLIASALLLCLLAVVATGLVMPVLDGRPVILPALAPIELPFPGDPQTVRFLAAIHGWAANAFLPLVALHLLVALKHHFLDRDTIALRMFRSVTKGK